ncbi:MAG: AAA family ATPase [Burkholderiaceae bacterium]
MADSNAAGRGSGGAEIGELTLADQSGVVGQLMQALTAAQAPPAVELIETHISFVLLAGGYAYKIKKAVNPGFLDFTTLARRRHFCQEELRLNQRIAPQLYLDIVPVTREGGQAALGGAGACIDVALRMRAFAQDALWDHRAAQGRLEPRHIDQLAQALCGFHRDAAVAPPDSPYGEPAQVRAPMLDTLQALQTLLGPSGRNRLADLRVWEAREFASLERHFARRRKAACVRECHGDLHLGNVTMVDEQPTMFDCLEFDADLRWTDVMNDVAFLAMDLRRHARTDFAHRFVNAYLERSGDYDGARLLAYYLVYRALVRTKVAALRSAQLALEPGSRPAAARDPALAYLDVACHCSAPSRPVLFITHGFSGSGKTTWAGHLLEQIGAVRIRADVERKRLLALPALAATASALRSGVYSSASTAATYERLRQAAACVLHGGLSAILDATFLQREQRDQARALAHKLGVDFVILDLRGAAATLRRRILARAEAGGDASEADLAVLDDQIAHDEPLGANERAEVFDIDAELAPSRATAQRVAELLRIRLAGAAAPPR